MAEIRLDPEEKVALLKMVLSFVQETDRVLEVYKPNSYVFNMMGYTVRMMFKNVITVSIGEDIAHMTAFTDEEKQIMSQIFDLLEKLYFSQDKYKDMKQYFLVGLGL